MTNGNDQSVKRKKKETKNVSERNYKARTLKKGPTMMVVDLGSKVHITSWSDSVVSQKNFDVDRALGEDKNCMQIKRELVQ